MPTLITQIFATANAEITYGPLRLAVAEWANVDPADVTGELVEKYQATRGQE